MSKTVEMARISAKGGFHVLWGLVVSTFISSVGTIIIALVLGPDNYGLYSIALNAPNLIQMFRDWGVNNAMIKYSAQYNSEGNMTKIRSIFVSGLIFMVGMGLLLALLTFALSGVLATTFNRPEITSLIQVSSFMILASALVAVATAAFTGMETMHLNSVMLIVQATVKTVLVVGLVLLGLGTLGAIAGFVLALFFAGITGLLLMWTMYRSYPKPDGGKLAIISTIKSLISYGLPLSIGQILTGFLTAFYGYVLAIYVSNNATIGNYNVATNFVVLITFFSVPVTTMLFPAFSKLDAKKDHETLKYIFQYSVKYASLLVVPVAAIIMVLAQPGINTIFQDKYLEAPVFLALLAIPYLYTALGNLSISSIILGQGYTKFSMKTTILSVAIGFPLSFVMISHFGVYGLILTMLTTGLPSLFLSLRFIKKRFDVSVDWLSSAKILVSSGITALLTYIIISLSLVVQFARLVSGLLANGFNYLFSLLPSVHFTFSQTAFATLIILVFGVLFFTAIFLFTAVSTRTINRADLANLREMSRGLGPIRKPFNLALNVIEKLMNVLQPKKTDVAIATSPE